ncbi:helix-turn-helix domain-containing protein [Crocinitomix catalasitica]|uniref:helix-turn-helix domain-containing protein n=1 Tax=Crocinitomix catalasitica TaxID=184607 RepID=UPI000480822A|nr:helix-turn-helix domain-containing protein [Crocinitomix catalasitica]
MRLYTNLKQTLSFCSVENDKPYFLSLASTAADLNEKAFHMDFYSFGICTEGKMTMEVDNNDYKIEANSFLIAAPSTTVRFKDVSQDIQFKYLLFEKNFLLKNLSNPFIIEKTVLFQKGTYAISKTDDGTSKNLQNILNYLELKSNQAGKFTDEIVRTIIINLILEVAEITHQIIPKIKNEDKTISDVYLAFRKLILENILINKSVQYYADKLNISNKYLIEIVKKASDRTPHEIIDELLLKEAYVLLGDTTLTISEIAFKLQFNSISAFGRFFKKKASLSPSQYRLKENLQH